MLREILGRATLVGGADVGSQGHRGLHGKVHPAAGLFSLASGDMHGDQGTIWDCSSGRLCIAEKQGHGDMGTDPEKSTDPNPAATTLSHHPPTPVSSGAGSGLWHSWGW